MSSTNARRLRRRNERESMRHLKKLGDILGEFYTFLESKPQPSNESVRAEFIRQENRWKGYCKAEKLNDEASSMFNREVSLSWQNRYTQKSNPEN